MHPFSESLGSTTRLIEISKALSRVGFNVTIYDPFERTSVLNSIKISEIKIAGSMDFMAKKVYSLLRKIYYSKIAKNLTSNKIFDNNILYNRIIKDLTKKINTDKIDVLIIEQDFAIFPGVKAAERANIPVIVDLHNITAEELVAAGIISEKSEEYHQMQKKLKMLLSRVDGLVVVSQALYEYVIKEYEQKSNLIIVPPAGSARINTIPNRPKPYKFIYAGLVSYRENVDLFIRSIPYFAPEVKDYEVYMTEKGEELKDVKKLSRKVGLNIKFFWFNRRENLFDLMKICHVGILTSSTNTARMLGPPIKLFDYMSVGLPVIANYIGGWSEIINQERIGIATNNTPKDFADAIMELLSDMETYYKYAFNALKLIKEKYNWDIVIQPLVEMIKKICC